MKPSERAIAEYQELRQRHHSDNITPEQAEREALELLRLVTVLQTVISPIDTNIECEP